MSGASISARGVGRLPAIELASVPLLAIVAVFAILALLEGRAHAHAVGLSRGEYTVHGPEVDAELTFARGELSILVPLLDPDKSGIRPATIDASRAALARAVVDRIVVTGDGKPCTGALEDAHLAEEDGFTLRARYRCPEGATKLSFTLAVLDDLAHGHRHLAHVTSGGASSDVVAFRGSDHFAADATGSAPTEAAHIGVLAMLRMGVEHILTGYDHLMFLLGLILVGGRLRALIGVITAFTLAHSITLALAALGVWSPSPRIVEPAIALSIAYVGVENFFVANADKRWRITFPFGLVHGFGFAGALREISLPRAQVPAALVMFNLGVEAGQLAVLAVVLPLVLAARRYEWFRGRGVNLLSACVAGAGAIWFYLRVAAP